MKAGPDRSTLTAFLGAVVIGGTNFVAVKFSNDELDPMWGAALRFTLAAAVLFAIARVMRLPMPRGRTAVGALIYGVLGFGIAYACLYIALVGLAPGVASVLVAGTPLFTLVVAVLHGQERFSTRGLIGGLLAMAGIGILSSGSLGGDLPIGYLLAALAGVIAVAESSVQIKNYPKAHPVTANALGMAAGVVVLVIGSLVAGERWALPATTRTWLVLAWLVIAGSVGLFILFLFVIGRWTASASVYALTLMPVVAVSLGALFGQDDITLGLVAGGILVVAAVYIGARPHEPEAADAPEPFVVAPDPEPVTER